MMVPALRHEPAFRSALSLQDRKTGHGMFITFWAEEAEAANFPTSAAFRTALGAITAISTGERAPIAVYEVVAEYGS
jgi:heme-degrading monooxygenase HmoA